MTDATKEVDNSADKNEIHLQQLQPKKGSMYSDIKVFEDGQRIAKALSSADLVPDVYKNNIPNTMIALEVANRIGVSPFLVMQNLHVIKGKPSWSSSFIIAALNSCGRFSPLRFRFMGDNTQSDDYGCMAFAKDIETGDLIEGPTVTLGMVKNEGWFSKKDKNGKETSKWKTMPELMFQYRAASFFGRLYAPDILNGMHTAEEILDVGEITSGLDRNAKEKERKRIIDWIANAQSISSLNQVKDSLGEDQQLIFEFENKMNEFKNVKDGF